ncbi:MAG: cation transporter [Phycisphaerae bacterium]|nr:cation transporter [Phycisphaerae bacterium]
MPTSQQLSVVGGSCVKLLLINNIGGIIVYMKAIVKKIIGSDINKMHILEVRRHYGNMQAWLSIFINLVLFIIKLIIGLVLNSVSLVADAIHTLSDCGSSIVVLIGFKASCKPGDREHPFGHGQAEHIAGLIVAITLIVAGIELFKSSTMRIIHPVATAHVSFLVLVIMIGTIIAKELMGRFAIELGNAMDSQALKADGWHHRSDAISTVFVVIAIWCSNKGYGWVDGVAGLVVAGIVVQCGYKLAKQAIHPLLGQRPSMQVIEEIDKIANGVPGVQAVHDVIVHQYGQTRMISLHIEVQSQLSAMDLHDIAENVERELARQLCQHVVVHIDPINTEHPQYQKLYDTIAEAIKNYDYIEGFQDMRIIGHDENSKAIFSLIVQPHLSKSKSRFIIENLYKELNGKFDDIKIAIKLKPQYSSKLPD